MFPEWMIAKALLYYGILPLTRAIEQGVRLASVLSTFSLGDPVIVETL